MSPVSPAVVPPASLSGVSGLLGIPSGYVDIVDFNGSATRLPPLTGPDRVGVHHFTVKHDLGFQLFPPAPCNNVNASLSQLRDRYGEDGVSFINETCSGFRHIPVSVFYPTCESTQLKTASVFTQSVLETIADQVFGDINSMHNMDSQAFLDAPVCADKYPMIILSPPIGGQRQAYTQLASDIASHHHVVVTVDHAFQSGAVESETGNVLFNLAGELIKPREADSGRLVDLMAVALHFNDSLNLNPLLWTTGTDIDLLNTYVFGHGQGGLVARMMVTNNLLSAGGTLDNLVRMPAPYNESNILYKPRPKHSRTIQPQPTSQPKPRPGTGDDAGLGLGDIAGKLGDSLGERLKNMARGLRKTMMDSLSSLICRVLGTCGTLVQKREFTSTSYDHDDWDIHEEKSCDDVCFRQCKIECKPDVPHGLFPDDQGQSFGKTRPDDGDWSADWQEYHDSIGDYKGFPGRNPYRQHEKSCYDDDYCTYKCCSKEPQYKDGDDWEDEHENSRHHNEDQQNEWDGEDEGQVPDQWRNEDDTPVSEQDEAAKTPIFDDGAENSSGKHIALPEDEEAGTAGTQDAAGDSADDDEGDDEEPFGESDGLARNTEGAENEL